jgi:hypothetical protein
MWNNIVIGDWLEFKPYNEQTDFDNYFVKLSNKVKKHIVSHDPFIEKNLGKKSVKELACYLCSYFEDVISETKIWASFVKLHEQMYSRKLPFYEEPEEYFTDEVNYNDICFLIWNFLDSHYSGAVFDPEDDFIFDLANDVYTLFEAEYETAQENKFIKNFYTIPTDEKVDLVSIRDFLEDIIINSYLFHYDTKADFTNSINQLLTIDSENAEQEIYNYKNKFIFSATTNLLALKAKDWGAEILGEEHPLYDDIKKLSPIVEGYFKIGEITDKYINLTHYATNKKIELLKESLDNDQITERNTLITSIIKFRGEWNFCGVCAMVDLKQEDIEQIKVDQKEKTAFILFNETNPEHKQLINFHKECFKVFTQRDYIFLPENEIDNFTQQFVEFANKVNDVGNDDPYKFVEENDVSLFEHKTYEEISEENALCTIFFNPRVGIEIAFDVQSAFTSKDNPYFEKEDEYDDVNEVITNGQSSKELCSYIIENFGEDIEFFNTHVGEHVIEHFDFFMRHYKKNSYNSTPLIMEA